MKVDGQGIGGISIANPALSILPRSSSEQLVRRNDEHEFRHQSTWKVISSLKRLFKLSGPALWLHRGDNLKETR
jgi:hypothetical protein